MLDKIINKVNSNNSNNKKIKKCIIPVTNLNKKIRFSGKYSQWRKAVYKRDNYTCQVCSRRGKINAHHILSFAKWKSKRFNIDNGITLCSSCHYRFHKKYGKSNFPNIKVLLKEGNLKL